MTVNEIIAILEDAPDDVADADVVLFPPENDPVTDEDSDDEDDPSRNPNHFGKGILSQLGEIQTDDKEDEQPDLIEGAGRVDDVTQSSDTGTEDAEEEAPPEPGPSRKRGRPARVQEEPAKLSR